MNKIERIIEELEHRKQTIETINEKLKETEKWNPSVSEFAISEYLDLIDFIKHMDDKQDDKQVDNSIEEIAHLIMEKGTHIYTHGEHVYYLLSNMEDKTWNQVEEILMSNHCHVQYSNVDDVYVVMF